MHRPAAWLASEKLQGLIAVSEHGALDVQARMPAYTEYSGELLRILVQIEQFSLGGQKAARMVPCPNWNANNTAWYGVSASRYLPSMGQTDTIWRALSMPFCFLFLASFFQNFLLKSPRGDNVFSASVQDSHGSE